MKQSLAFYGGAKLEKSHALEGRNELFIYIEDSEKTLIDVFPILSDARNTKKIVYEFGDDVKLEFDGYTKLIAIRDEGNAITAILVKEEQK